MSDKGHKKEKPIEAEANQDPKNSDAELNDLLDSALQDLLDTKSSSEPGPPNASPADTTPAEGPAPQDDLEAMFKHLLTGTDAKFDEAMSDPEKYFADVLKNIANVDPTQHDSENSNSQPDAIGDAIPQIFDLMRNLISRDLLYPALKDLAPRYEVWLEKNEGKMKRKDMARYKEQNGLIKQICENFENEQLSENQRFEMNLELMEKMRSLGTPPDDLVPGGSSSMPAFPGLFG